MISIGKCSQTVAVYCHHQLIAVCCHQVIRMLIVVVVVFATLWMPYRVMVVYNSFAEHKYLNLWFLMFSRTLIYINCAINPILYNVMSVKFRRAFKNHLCCGECPDQTS